ncbi:hypothetical protein CH063_13316 [Colletotrichum higginsianum]|uniref:Uncharacterized protein n=1 Tax=Colletotrichum higginsianum (strain IMI 349063) TaxID=759273 RepID=H1VTX7_COLHI|nr:hypothetical protein CH063_13316 [Colletotrichum higginsianum]
MEGRIRGQPRCATGRVAIPGQADTRGVIQAHNLLKVFVLKAESVSYLCQEIWAARVESDGGCCRGRRRACGSRVRKTRHLAESSEQLSQVKSGQVRSGRVESVAVE